MNLKYLIVVLTGFFFLSCSKRILDEKPNNALLVPRTLDDFNALLNNVNTFNFSPSLQFISSDDFYITDNGWAALPLPQERNSYFWADDIYESEQSVNDWDRPYRQVFYANIILDGLNQLGHLSESSEYKNVKGAAYFHRAFAFHNLAQLFALPYAGGANSSQLGIPLRLEADVNIKSFRNTIGETYNQIIDDLLQSVELLPEQGMRTIVPTKAAALALLSRVYLSMEDYENALAYANQALEYNDKLIDYNLLDPTAARPFPAALQGTNDEVIFYSELGFTLFYFSSQLSVDSNLYETYNDWDLRKTLFYTNGENGIRNFKGSYSGDALLFFGGLATDELYLTKIECLVRDGELLEAINTLKYYLSFRYSSTNFNPEFPQSQTELLNLVLLERRKQLVERGIRWADLRRLNNSHETAITLERDLNGTIYELPSNSNKYVLPIPQIEIELNSLVQNPR